MVLLPCVRLLQEGRPCLGQEAEVVEALPYPFNPLVLGQRGRPDWVYSADCVRCSDGMMEENMHQDPVTTSEDDVSYSARRLNYLARGLKAENYLEIGVFNGDTFRDVEVANKTGVDPEFRFDWRELNDGSSIILKPTTSDSFFETLDPGQRFDLIFIDGLHTFDQSYRDIINALRHAHSRTVILIDDTIPCDVFSTCREQQECIQLRAIATGGSDERWNGDTYKLIPLLALFHPNLNYSTIQDRGYPQTLLWQKAGNPWVESISQMQAFWAVSNLSQCDYLWLLNNLGLYSLAFEDEALARVLADLELPHCLD